MRKITQQVITATFAAMWLFSTSHLVAVSERAACQADTVLSKDPKIGLSREQLIAAFDYIETHLNSKGKGKGSYSKKRTKLACTIEKCPSMQGYLLRDIEGKHIGKGAHKIIRKAIYYGPETKLIADCDCDFSGKGEIKVLRQLKGKKGIVPFLGSRSYSKNRHSIFLEYFPLGSLRRNLKHNTPFTERQMVQIASDMASAIQTMHKKHLIHRDLHEGNILLRTIPNNGFEAVLVDFGKTLSISNAKDAYPQVPASKNPPENLLQPLGKIDRYQGEVYALGCLFYHLVWKEPQPWSYVFNVRRISETSLSKRAKLHDTIVSLYKKTRHEKVGRLLSKQERRIPLTPFEQLQVTIFEMLHYNPQKRPEVKTVVERLEKLRPSNRIVSYSKEQWIAFFSEPIT